MTAEQVQIRRDTATNLNAATPATGELGYDTTNKRLVIGDGSTAGGIKVTMAKDLQNQTYVAGTVGGTGDAITLTNSPVVAAYASGQRFTFKAGAANTGAVTLNVDGLGAKNVKKMNNGALAALAANDIISGGMFDVFYDGTQFQIKALAEGPFTSALKFLGSATASASATIDLTSLLSSTYDDYLIIFDNVVPATASATLRMRASTDNSTFDSGANYNSSVVNSLSTGGTPSTTGSAAATSHILTSALDNTYGMSGALHIFGANTAAKPKFMTCHSSSLNGNGSTWQQDTSGGVWNNITDTLQAIRFFMSSGNITSGTFRVYGIAKA